MNNIEINPRRMETVFKQFYKSPRLSPESKGRIYTPESIRKKMLEISKPEKSDKILVMFNIEFCGDLYLQGFENVTFVSDDSEKNLIVNKVFGYETISLGMNINNIKVYLKDMTFDLIISNPPYSSMNSQMIDINILESAAQLSENVCFIMPVSSCITKNNISPKYQKFIPMFNSRMTSLEIISNELFENVGFSTDLGIIYLIKSNDGIIHYKNDNTSAEYQCGSIDEINKFENNECFLSIRDKSKKVVSLGNSGLMKYTAEEEATKEYCGLAVQRGHKGTADWHTIVSKDYGLHYKYNQKNKVIFDTAEECKNFYEYLKLPIIRFIYGIDKDDTGQRFGFPIMKSFKRSWSNEEVMNVLGITEQEMKYAIQFVDDYYPEDKEKYAKYRTQTNV